MNFYSPKNWQDYELIDTGSFKKLERFGEYYIIRPEPQAIWRPYLKMETWYNLAHLEYIPIDSYKGEWKNYKNAKNNWIITYKINNDNKNEIKIYLQLSTFKNIGIFPEQAFNWDFLWNKIKSSNKELRVLNLFAYTGIASIICAKAGAFVTHIDSLKSAINIANFNAKLNNISTIRWIRDDVLKFTKRELKRKNKYNIFILDPPAFGHGPNGEIWKFEENFYELIEILTHIADKNFLLLCISVYSLGLSPLVIENVIRDLFPYLTYETGELYFTDKNNRKLPLGIFIHAYNF